MDCTNYRGISLMSIVGKVFAGVLNERVKVLTMDKVMDEQGGFRAGIGDALTKYSQSSKLLRKQLRRTRRYIWHL